MREYQRRHDAREQHARAKLGRLGVVLAKVIDEPASTRVWQQGANGEVRVAERLEHHLDGTGVRLLHDSRVLGHGRANIDHLAVGPGGVTVIDSKTHRGKITRDWYGGLFVERRTILRIDGRDQTKLITGVEKQIGYVRSALAKLELGDELDVSGALCFPNVDGLPWFRRIEIRGILVDGPKRSHISPPGRDDSTPEPSSGSGWISATRFPLLDRTEPYTIASLRTRADDYRAATGRRDPPRRWRVLPWHRESSLGSASNGSAGANVIVHAAPGRAERRDSDVAAPIGGLTASRAWKQSSDATPLGRGLGPSCTKAGMQS